MDTVWLLEALTPLFGKRERQILFYLFLLGQTAKSTDRFTVLILAKGGLLARRGPRHPVCCLFVTFRRRLFV